MKTLTDIVKTWKEHWNSLGYETMQKEPFFRDTKWGVVETHESDLYNPRLNPSGLYDTITGQIERAVTKGDEMSLNHVVPITISARPSDMENAGEAPYSSVFGINVAVSTEKPAVEVTRDFVESLRKYGINPSQLIFEMWNGKGIKPSGANIERETEVIDYLTQNGVEVREIGSPQEVSTDVLNIVKRPFGPIGSKAEVYVKRKNEKPLEIGTIEFLRSYYESEKVHHRIEERGGKSITALGIGTERMLYHLTEKWEPSETIMEMTGVSREVADAFYFLSTTLTEGKGKSDGTLRGQHKVPRLMKKFGVKRLEEEVDLSEILKEPIWKQAYERATEHLVEHAGFRPDWEYVQGEIREYFGRKK